MSCLPANYSLGLPKQKENSRQWQKTLCLSLAMVLLLSQDLVCIWGGLYVRSCVAWDAAAYHLPFALPFSWCVAMNSLVVLKILSLMTTCFLELSLSHILPKDYWCCLRARGNVAGPLQWSVAGIPVAHYEDCCGSRFKWLSSLPPRWPELLRECLLLIVYTTT